MSRVTTLAGVVIGGFRIASDDGKSGRLGLGVEMMGKADETGTTDAAAATGATVGEGTKGGAAGGEVVLVT